MVVNSRRSIPPLRKCIGSTGAGPARPAARHGRAHPVIGEQSFVKRRRLRRCRPPRRRLPRCGRNSAPPPAQFNRYGRSTSGETKASARLIAVSGANGPTRNSTSRTAPDIAPQQIPVPVDRHRGKRLLLGQHVIERAADVAKLGSSEVRLPPDRRKAGRDQQCVVLTQRHVERDRKPHHHIAARQCAAQFKEAQMALRNLGAPGKIELRQAPASAPAAETRLQICVAAT